jgi:hypothetical protein
VDAITEHVLESHSARQGAHAQSVEVIQVETDNGARWL